MTTRAQGEARRRVAGMPLRLGFHSPFMGRLCMFARYVPSETTPAFGTDGLAVFYTPEVVLSLDAAELEERLLHQVLHAVLQHHLVPAGRQPGRWALAADIHVEGLVAQRKHQPSRRANHRPVDLEDLPVDELYDLLARVPEGALGSQCFAPASSGEARPTDEYWGGVVALLEAEKLSFGGWGGGTPPSWLEPLKGRKPLALPSPEGVDAILEGRGGLVRFPEEPPERAGLLTALLTRTTSAAQATATLRWLRRRAEPEWLPFWGSKVLMNLRAHEQMTLFAEAVGRDPDLQAFLRDYQNLLLGQAS